jgi:hypothetical protein
MPTTALTLAIHAALEAARDPVIERLDPPRTRIEWPGQPRNIWPFAAVSGELRSREMFYVGVDDQDDPVRSVVKLWPLLHAVREGTRAKHVVFFEISSPSSTEGRGFQLLARFVAERLAETYGGFFRHGFTDLAGKTAEQLAAEVLRFLRGEVAPTGSE